MEKPNDFPFEHKGGGLLLRTCSAPQVRTEDEGTKKTDESFLVKYDIEAFDVGGHDMVDAMAVNLSVVSRSSCRGLTRMLLCRMCGQLSNSQNFTTSRLCDP